MDLSPELHERLGEIADERCTSKADVLRRAFALFEVAVEGEKDGMSIGLAEDPDNLDREIIF